VEVPQVRFVVMNNLLRTDVPLHRKFDLKGSTQGREAPPEASIQKDLNVDMRLLLPGDWHQRCAPSPGGHFPVAAVQRQKAECQGPKEALLSSCLWKVQSACHDSKVSGSGHTRGHAPAVVEDVQRGTVTEFARQQLLGHTKCGRRL
jgi:Phosphatidylinositol-4-phosphate 5-Kinase